MKKTDKEYEEIRNILNETREKIISHDGVFRIYEVMNIIDNLAEKMEKILVEE